MLLSFCIIDNSTLLQHQPSNDGCCFIGELLPSMSGTSLVPRHLLSFLVFNLMSPSQSLSSQWQIRGRVQCRVWESMGEYGRMQEMTVNTPQYHSSTISCGTPGTAWHFRQQVQGEFKFYQLPSIWDERGTLDNKSRDCASSRPSLQPW